MRPYHREEKDWTTSILKRGSCFKTFDNINLSYVGIYMILSLRNKQLRKEHTDPELARVLTDLINVLVPWVVLQTSPHSNSSFHPKIKKITSL